jgi:hypothetical protein
VLCALFGSQILFGDVCCVHARLARQTHRRARSELPGLPCSLPERMRAPAFAALRGGHLDDDDLQHASQHSLAHSHHQPQQQQQHSSSLRPPPQGRRRLTGESQPRSYAGPDAQLLNVPLSAAAPAVNISPRHARELQQLAEDEA